MSLLTLAIMGAILTYSYKKYRAFMAKHPQGGLQKETSSRLSQR